MQTVCTKHVQSVSPLAQPPPSMELVVSSHAVADPWLSAGARNWASPSGGLLRVDGAHLPMAGAATPLLRGEDGHESADGGGAGSLECGSLQSRPGGSTWKQQRPQPGGKGEPPKSGSGIALWKHEGKHDHHGTSRRPTTSSRPRPTLSAKRPAPTRSTRSRSRTPGRRGGAPRDQQAAGRRSSTAGFGEKLPYGNAEKDLCGQPGSSATRAGIGSNGLQDLAASFGWTSPTFRGFHLGDQHTHRHNLMGRLNSAGDIRLGNREFSSQECAARGSTRP